MKHLTKGAVLLALGVLLLAAPSVQAQISCNECDPYATCGTPCWYCDPPSIDYCPQYNYYETTCDDYRGACQRGDCSPSWQTTERVTVGQYGETTYGIWCPWPYCYPTFGCDHHIVDRVTQHDYNECNISEAYNDRVFCDDYVNFSLPHRTGSAPDCCAYPYYCNDWHSCF
jgi:hypothetical protein